MKSHKEIEKLEKRVKAIEDSMGLGTEGAKDLQMLVRTIRVQGNEENLIRQQAEIFRQQLMAREDFIGEKKLTADFQAWYNEKIVAKKAKENPPPPSLELKEGDKNGKIERKEPTMDEDKKKQIVNEDKTEDATKAIEDSKKEVVNDA